MCSRYIADICHCSVYSIPIRIAPAPSLFGTSVILEEVNLTLFKLLSNAVCIFIFRIY
ncbi:hypothetical protein [Candidatus Ichthyocystis sparus]|uniref:hypothetical protein n=1 Tax=Candidatus Ichthyocystis sparus TaxID=1561004 RepID=UPI00159EEAA0|nr:hypothetical protein [Candidatus Ichthyocystis sparus]